MIKVLDLFSGIGGFSLGLHWAGGFETVGFCEIEPFCQKVIRKNFPGTPIMEDINDFEKHYRTLKWLSNGATIDLITAGLPCQPFSQGGKRQGADDPRHLWPPTLRAIRLTQPRFVVLENVTGLLSIDGGRVFGRILRELAQSGYDAEWAVLSAAHFGYPHQRDRVWIVAYATGMGLGENAKILHRPLSALRRRSTQEYSRSNSQTFFDVPDDCPVPFADGLPKGVDWAGSIKAYGNGIVPDIARWIGEGILNSWQ